MKAYQVWSVYFNHPSDPVSGGCITGMVRHGHMGCGSVIYCQPYTAADRPSDLRGALALIA